MIGPARITRFFGNLRRGEGRDDAGMLVASCRRDWNH
jgi:hypothetical protein